jgi:pyruvate carboxylase
VRLDGGMGYGGAVVTPFYDSLLVKLTVSRRPSTPRCSAWTARCANSASAA